MNITILIIFIIIIVVLLLIRKILEYINNSLLFTPTKLISPIPMDDIISMYKNYGFPYLQIKNGFVKTHDNEHLNYIYLQNPSKKKTILFSHGNSGNIYKPNFQILSMLLKHGSVFMYDYRGYGISSGSPSENSLNNDIETIYNFLTTNIKLQPKQIILYGESLGCSVSSYLAYKLSLLNDSNFMPLLVILQSGFYSLSKLTGEVNAIFPLLQVLNFDNSTYIKNIKGCPILVIHSEEDELIGIHHAYELKHDTGCIVYKIKGSHGMPIFTKSFNKYLKNFIKKI